MKKLELLLLFLIISWKLQGQELTDSFSKKSVLSKGEFYKIAIENSGVYKLDFQFFNEIGINPEILNINRIKVYGNPGGMLPQSNSAKRYDDLLENHIWIKDFNNNKHFDEEDYILFYAYGPDEVYYDEVKQMFLQKTNLYTDFNYYFIEIFSRKSDKIGSIESNIEIDPEEAISTFDFFHYHENENFNLLSSGKEWYGEKFNLDDKTTHHFKLKDYLPIKAADVRMWVQSMNRETVPVQFDIKVNNQPLGEIEIDAVSRSAFGEKGKVKDWYNYFSSESIINNRLTSDNELDIEIIKKVKS